MKILICFQFSQQRGLIVMIVFRILMSLRSRRLKNELLTLKSSFQMYSITYEKRFNTLLKALDKFSDSKDMNGKFCLIIYLFFQHYSLDFIELQKARIAFSKGVKTYEGLRYLERDSHIRHCLLTRYTILPTIDS